MAGNKYSPPPRPHKPSLYVLQYGNAQGTQETIQGTARQVILHILNQKCHSGQTLGFFDERITKRVV